MTSCALHPIPMLSGGLLSLASVLGSHLQDRAPRKRVAELTVDGSLLLTKKKLQHRHWNVCLDQEHSSDEGAANTRSVGQP